MFFTKVKSSPFGKFKSLKPPRVKESYFATCERDDAGHCLPKGEQGTKKPDEPKKEEVKPESKPIDSIKKPTQSIKNKVGDVREKMDGWVPSNQGTLSSPVPPGVSDYTVSTRKNAVRQIMEKGLAVKDAAVLLSQLDDGISKENFINSITKGEATKAVKDLAGIPLYDLHVLGGVNVVKGKHPSEGVCYMADRKIEVGTESATGTIRHELGHALHAFYGTDTGFFNDAINDHYAEAMKKAKAKPVKGKQTHEWYEENYGIIGSRALDNAKEDFAEHYRGYHKAIYQDKHEGGGGKMLERYRKLHPEMAVLFDAHYTAALLGLSPDQLGKLNEGESKPTEETGKSKEGQPCGPGETPEQTGCIPQKDEPKAGDKYKIDYDEGADHYVLTTSNGTQVDTYKYWSDASKAKDKYENMFDNGETKQEFKPAKVVKNAKNSYHLADADGNQISGNWFEPIVAQKAADQWNAFGQANPNVKIIRKDTETGIKYEIVDEGKVVGEGSYFTDAIKTAENYVLNKKKPDRPDEAPAYKVVPIGGGLSGYAVADPNNQLVSGAHYDSQEVAEIVAKDLTAWNVATKPQPEKISEPFPQVKTADTSGWNSSDVAAQTAAAAIKAMEFSAENGLWAILESHQPNYPTSTLNQYQKAVVDSWQKLMQQKAAKDDVVNVGSWKKVGSQLGSNPGGKYQDENGKDWYVKFSKSDDHARNEVLAAKLYELAGAAVTEYHLADTGLSPEASGILGTATAWAEHGDAFNPSGDFDKDAAVANFAVHAWLGNWDAVGLNNDNQQWVKVPDSKQQKLLTVDTGGAMLYRAQGEPKAFGKSVSEWNTLRDEMINPQSAAVFGQMTPDQLSKAAIKVAAISDESIDAMVDKYATDTKKHSLKEILKARRDWIAGAASGQVSLPEVASNANEGQPETKVIPPTLPPPPVFKDSHHKTSQKYVNQLHELAMKVASDPENHQLIGELAGKKYPPSYKKVVKYQFQLINALNAGSKPPIQLPKAQKPPKPVDVSSGPVKIDPSKFPPKPEFVSKVAANVAMNNEAVGKLHALATAGDMTALQSHPIPASPKLQAWKNELVQSLETQLNPPKPPKPYSGQLADLSKKHFKVFKNRSAALAAKAQFIGLYAVTEEPGVLPESMPKVKYKVGTGNKITDAAEQARHEAAWNAMTEKEQKQVLHYTGPGSSLNAALRNETNDSTFTQAKNIAKTLHKHAVEMTPGTYLERNVGYLGDTAMKLLKVSAGKVIQDFGFGSTSVDYEKGGNVTMKLTAAPGARGLYIGHKSGYKGEKEYLLPPGYRVLVTKVNVGGSVVIEGLILATDPEQCC